MKRILKYLLILGGLVFLGYLFVLFQYGSIDIKSTLRTEYHPIENSRDQIVETDFFELKTPDNWVHLFGGYSNEGDPNGCFQTSKGVIHYEYGVWAPNYGLHSEIYEYTVEHKTIDRFQILIVRNKLDEVGISILEQNEMNGGFTFHMDESVDENLNEIIEGIRNLKFK